AFRSSRLLLLVILSMSPSSLAMTGITARQDRRALDVVVLDQAPPQLFLLGRRFILHVEDALPGTNVQLRIAMAAQAPLHLQGCDLPGDRHLVDATVAGRAPHAFVHVNAVIEVDEVGQIVHSGPFYRLTCAKAVANRLQCGAVSPYLAVAIHAGFGGRDAGEGGSLYRGMAISAVDPIIADMVFVTELNRLLPRCPCLGSI